MRTQKPVGVTAAGFYHISLQSYYDVRIYLRDFECSSKIDSIFRCWKQLTPTLLWWTRWYIIKPIRKTVDTAIVWHGQYNLW